MGMSSIVDRIEKIFANPNNFDVSGFCKAELVTPELAEDLANLGYEEVKELQRLGYNFHWFNFEQDDGIISKWFKGKGPNARYSLRLYFNQLYPKAYPIDIKKGLSSDEHGTRDI